MKQNFLIFLLFSIWLSFILLNNVNAVYLPWYESYKQLWDNIIWKHNQEYQDYKYNQLYKKTAEYQEWEKEFVKVKTILDISQEELDNKIKSKKNDIINKLKNSTDKNVWVTKIDSIISALDKDPDGKYIYMEVPWEFVPIKEWEYIYVYPHRLKWNVKLLDKIQSIIKVYNKKDGKEKISIADNSNEYREKLLNLFDEYKIQYKVINNHYIDVDLFIGKKQNIKQMVKKPFFISKWFTTPELELEVEENKKVKNYIWTYLTNEDLEYSFWTKNANGSEILAKIWWKNYYLWRLSLKEKYYNSKFSTSNLDLFVYKIHKNNYEYILLFLFLIFWIWLAIYLTNNFIHNYKNNFKKIPEEI